MKRGGGRVDEGSDSDELHQVGEELPPWEIGIETLCLKPSIIITFYKYLMITF